MKLSRKGTIFIARFEAWMPGLYNDVGGNAHIGYGHFIHTGVFTEQDIREWEPPISKKYGLGLLQQDADVKATAVRGLVHIPLRQGQFDALVSFAFNLGTGAFAESPIPKLLNRGDSKNARKALLKYDHAEINGVMVRLPGLTRRRRAEARLFRTGNYFLARL